MNKGIIFAVLGFISFLSTAQKKINKPNFNHAVSITVTDFFIGKITANYEFSGFKKSNYAPSLHVFLGSNFRESYGDNDYDYTRKSYGIELSNKIYTKSFFSFKGESKSLYINPAIRYQKFEFSYLGEAWIPFKDNDITFFDFKEGVLLKPSAERIALAPQIGIVFTRSHLFMDIYTGISILRDVVTGNIGNHDLPLNGWDKVRLTNFTFFGGLKIGVSF